MTKRGGLLNYTTSIAIEQTIGEILGMLVKGGASRITTDYEAGQPVGVAFTINTPYGVRGYRLPASIGAGTRPRKSASISKGRLTAAASVVNRRRGWAGASCVTGWRRKWR